jgi:hypothetical protein
MSHHAKPRGFISCLAWQRAMPALGLVLVGFALAGRPLLSGDTRATVAKRPAPPEVEIHLTDGSTLKVALREGHIGLETRYGKLLIPVADIRRIEFSQRLSDDVRRRVETAIADLGSKEYRRRQAASAALLTLGEKGYPALFGAAKSGDQETARRAEQILEKLRAAIPAENLEIRPDDVVYTADCKIAGRITASSLRVKTLAFGEQSLRLEDMRSLRSLGATGPQTAALEVLPDPGNLMAFQAQIGKTFAFRVTGPAPAQAGGVYGTDVYTMDSSLALAAVHAGIVQPGQTGVVRVTILGQQPGFQASLRHGVMSSPYGTWAGFRIEPPRARPR